MTDQDRGRIFSVREVLFVLFKRQRMIISIFLITVATVTVGVFLTKPVYEASVKVFLNREVTESVLRATPWIPLYRSFDLEEEINSEIELIKSRGVMEAALDKLDQQAAIEKSSPSQEVSLVDVTDAESSEESRLKRILKLQKDIIAEPVKKSDIIQIRYRSTDPKRAMEIVNATAEAYIGFRAKIYRISGAADFFDDQIQIARRNLDQLESALKDYRQQEALLSYEKQETILLTKLNEFETSLTAVRKDIISKETKLAKIREFMSSPYQPLVPSLEMREERIISELHDRLVDLRLRLNEFLTKYTEDHREVANLKREIALGEAELRAEVEKVIDLEISSLEALRAEEKALSSTVGMLYAEVKKLPEKELTVGRLKTAIENHKEVYSMLVLKREEARISEARDGRMTKVSVISPATLPLKPVRPQKRLYLFVASLMGVIGGVGLAFVLEYLDHSLKTGEEVEHHLNLPVLASIPEMKQV